MGDLNSNFTKKTEAMKPKVLQISIYHHLVIYIVPFLLLLCFSCFSCQFCLFSEVLVIWSYPVLCDPIDCSLPGSSIHGIKNSPGKNTGVDCHSLLQGIFLTQEANLDLLHCRQILYHLSHQERTLISHQMWSLFPITGHSNNNNKNLLFSITISYLPESFPN